MPQFDVPAGLRDLFAAAGPILRYRIARDVLGRDESYVETAQLGFDVRKLPAVQDLLNAQDSAGGFGAEHPLIDSLHGRLTTKTAVLRLGECGLERHPQVLRCVDEVLVPALLPSLGQNRAVRDELLHLITRTTREQDDLVKPLLELLLTEWEQFLAAANKKELPAPSADGFAAVCHFPWSDDEFPAVRLAAARLFDYAERELENPRQAEGAFAIHEKWEYLAQPPFLFHDLELAARLGVVSDLPVTRWLLEELEARQDADGFFRFDSTEPIVPSWYFPLEAKTPDNYPTEYSFRAALIFKLMEYDL